MSTIKDKKKEIIDDFSKHDTDTGSPEVQIALLSERIASLTEHFKKHKEASELFKIIGW